MLAQMLPVAHALPFAPALSFAPALLLAAALLAVQVVLVEALRDSRSRGQVATIYATGPSHYQDASDARHPPAALDTCADQCTGGPCRSAGCRLGNCALCRSV